MMPMGEAGVRRRFIFSPRFSYPWMSFIYEFKNIGRQHDISRLSKDDRRQNPSGMLRLCQRRQRFSGCTFYQPDLSLFQMAARLDPSGIRRHCSGGGRHAAQVAEIAAGVL
jgi:hypothetical protein